MASGEGLRNTVGRINAIMCEASSNCLRPEIPYPTLYRYAIGCAAADHYAHAQFVDRARLRIDFELLHDTGKLVEGCQALLPVSVTMHLRVHTIPMQS